MIGSLTSALDFEKTCYINLHILYILCNSFQKKFNFEIAKTFMKTILRMFLVVGLVGEHFWIASAQIYQGGKDARDKQNYKKLFEVWQPLSEKGAMVDKNTIP